MLGERVAKSISLFKDSRQLSSSHNSANQLHVNQPAPFQNRSASVDEHPDRMNQANESAGSIIKVNVKIGKSESNKAASVNMRHQHRNSLDSSAKVFSH